MSPRKKKYEGFLSNVVVSCESVCFGGDMNNFLCTTVINLSPLCMWLGNFTRQICLRNDFSESLIGLSLYTPRKLLAKDFIFRKVEAKITNEIFSVIRSSPPELFLGKVVLEICSKFTGEDTCRGVISISWYLL